MKAALFSLLLLPIVATAQPNDVKPAQKAVSSPTQSVNTLKPRVKEALLTQVSREQYSSNLYLTFASYFADIGLDGGEKFFRKASAEETEHALIFYNELVDRQEKFQMKTVDQSQIMPTSPLDAFKKFLENEIAVTKSIQNIYAIALEENDYATQVFLHPFLTLQVQEEKEAFDLVQLLEMGATDPAFILVFDNKLAEMVEED